MTARRLAPPAAIAARATSWWAILVICIAAFAAYHNSFEGPFVFDDASSIVTNPTIRHLWPLTEPLSPPKTNVTAQGRPLLNLSLALNYAIGGTDVRGYHVVNLIIHALAGLTLFGIVRRTLNARRTFNAIWFALAVAVLWTVHPLQTESVTYIIQRAESLMGLFYLLTLYFFVRGTEFDWCSPARESRDEQDLAVQTVPSLPRRATSNLMLCFSVLACAAGMATKEVMATAPLMVLFFDRTFRAGNFREALRWRWRYYAALGSTWLLLAWLVAQTGGNRGGSVGFGVGVAWWEYWLTQFKAIAYYLRLSFWPAPLVFEYGSFWITRASEIILPALLVVALLAATIVGLARRSPLGFLGAWFFGILAPTSLAPGTTQMIVEHRMYLPLAAVVVFFVVLVGRMITERRARSSLWLFGSLAVIATIVTVRRNEDYRTEVALWRDTIAKRPGNPLAHFMLAGAWERVGDTERAVASYNEALRLKPDFSVGHENFGELLLKQSRRGEAIAHFEAALALQPEFADAHMNLGSALLAEGRVTDAVTHLATATRLAPGTAEMHYNFATGLAAAGRSDEAITEFQTALNHPAGTPAVHTAAHYHLANIFAMTSRQAEAVPHYETALLARPDFAEAHHNLGSALFELGRLAEAARHYEETLRLAPDFPNARENLARVRAKMPSK